MEKKDWINLILSIILGINAVVFAYLNYNINQTSLEIQAGLYDLTLGSIRGNLNVFVEPISVQNWTFDPEGVNANVNGVYTNEGSRTTMIKRIEFYAIFPYPDSGEEIFTIPVNLTTNFNISKLTIGESEQYAFSIDYFIMNHLVLNNETGQIMQIGGSMPSEVGVVIWHNDGMGIIIDSGETS